MPENEQLQRLLDAYFDHRADPTELAELEDLLLHSSAARREFWRQAKLCSALEQLGADARGARVLERFERDSAPAVKNGKRWALAATAIAASIFAAIMIVDSSVPDRAETPSRPDTAEATTPPSGERGFPVALVTRGLGAEWGGDVRIATGQTLLTGSFDLRSGLVELDFFSGARLLIEGPARFALVSDMRVTIATGRIHAEVPESAHGFVVEMPRGALKDLGTRFGMQVGEDGSAELHVLEGEVEYTGTGATDPLRLAEQRAVRIGPDGRVEAIDQSVAAPWVRPPLDEGEFEAFSKWKAFSDQLATDPTLLVYFRFVAPPAGRLLVNEARHPMAPKHATVISADFTQGRWEGKQALTFHRTSDRVRLDIDGSYPQVTYSAWVRADELNHTFNALFLSEHGIPGEAHWQLDRDGSHRFGVRPTAIRSDGHFHRGFGPPVIQPWEIGAWKLLATTYDAPSRILVHYVDGQEVFRQTLPESIALRFGRATLGNGSFPEKLAEGRSIDDWQIRNFGGTIDEFALFARILSPGEIREIYRNGHPD